MCRWPLKNVSYSSCAILCVLPSRSLSTEDFLLLCTHWRRLLLLTFQLHLFLSRRSLHLPPLARLLWEPWNYLSSWYGRLTRTASSTCWEFDLQGRGQVAWLCCDYEDRVWTCAWFRRQPSTTSRSGARQSELMLRSRSAQWGLVLAAICYL